MSGQTAPNVIIVKYRTIIMENNEVGHQNGVIDVTPMAGVPGVSWRHRRPMHLNIAAPIIVLVDTGATGIILSVGLPKGELSCRSPVTPSKPIVRSADVRRPGSTPLSNWKTV